MGVYDRGKSHCGGIVGAAQIDIAKPNGWLYHAPMIQIERGIPIPVTTMRGYNGNRGPRLPFAEMEVGDSILIPADRIINARIAANRFAAAVTGWKCCTQKQDGGSYRLWRTA